MSIDTNYIPTIGLEIHAELKTKSKLFCGCKNDPFCNPSTSLGASEPNIHTCPVCLGLPGALPVLNQQAVIDTVKIGQALGGSIAPITKWDRKHYFYPDLPKGYQISQYDLPLVSGGELNGIRITRIHLEEDTGKLLHGNQTSSSLVDLNRAGVPLVELVTEPDIHDGKTAAEFAREYQLILRALGVADAAMEKGMMRVEVNISLQQISNDKFQMTNKLQNSNIQISKLGTKVEIKNLNSFKSVERAIEYEIQRQTDLLRAGQEVVQETRGWSLDRGTTVSQRAKETSADYRYFPEPDLPAIDTAKLTIPLPPPLPDIIRRELIAAGVKKHEADILLRKPRLLAALNLEDKSLIPAVAQMLIHNPTLSDKSQAELVELVQMTAHQRKLHLAGTSIGVVLDEEKLDKLINQIITAHPQAVSDYRSGKQPAFGFLMGQVMREAKNQSNPMAVNRLLKEKLNQTSNPTA